MLAQLKTVEFFILQKLVFSWKKLNCPGDPKPLKGSVYIYTHLEDALQKIEIKQLIFSLCLNRRFKAYRPLKEDLLSAEAQGSPTPACSGTTMFQNYLIRQGAVDHCPLLQDRLV